MPTPHEHLALEMRLELDRFDPSRFEGVRRALREQGVSFTTLAEEVARRPGALDGLYALHNECRRRQPPVAMRAEPIPRERWDAAFVTGSEALPDGYFVAMLDGRYVGVSVVQRIASDPGALSAGFTGVPPAYSGRGIALGLKLETIEYARRHGYKEIRTGVLAENVAMVRVNERVGFVRTKEEVRSYTY